MALALPDNGEVNNREVRRLTTDSGGMADFEEDEDEEYEHHGELQNGEYDDEEVEAGAMPPSSHLLLLTLIAWVLCSIYEVCGHMLHADQDGDHGQMLHAVWGGNANENRLHPAAGALEPNR